MSDNKKHIFYLPVDCSLPPSVEKMLEEVAEAKKACDGLLGIPERRQGFVQYFQPQYQVADKYGIALYNQMGFHREIGVQCKNSKQAQEYFAKEVRKAQRALYKAQLDELFQFYTTEKIN